MSAGLWHSCMMDCGLFSASKQNQCATYAQSNMACIQAAYNCLLH